MKYAIIENGVISNIVEATPEFAEQHGWITFPEYDENNQVVGIGYLYQNGTFIKPPRNIQAEWAVVRVHRDSLLLASDINVLPDRWASMTSEQQTIWSTYRQTLRDIPTAFSDPANVVWPSSPN